MTTYREFRQRIIAEAMEKQDVAELRKLAEGQLCACLGPKDGEPLCPCKMISREVRSLVSYAALRRGYIRFLVQPSDHREENPK